MPDRIETAAGEVQGAAHELVTTVKRVTRKWWYVVGALVLAYVLLAAVVVDNRRDAQADRRHRLAQEARNRAADAQREEELLGRLCAAWENRIEDHATLTGYLAGYVGANDPDSVQFVNGLREAYARSDADYAEERGLSEERCP